MLDAVINPLSSGTIMNYFENITNLDDLRKAYHRLAFEHHPDRGGDNLIMQTINAQYERLSKKLIYSSDDFSEERKVYERNLSHELRKIIERVILLEGVTIELIGSWLWISGNTFPIREKLKSEGFKFSPPKLAWYWHEGEFIKRSKSLQSMEELRDYWGHQYVHSCNFEKRSITE